MKRTTILDKLESVLLLGLLLLAVYFSMELWFQPMTIVHQRESTTANVMNDGVENVLMPAKVLVNFSDSNHTMIYHNRRYTIWNHAKPIITELFNTKDLTLESIDTEDYLEELAKPSMVFNFSVPMNTALINQVLTGKTGGRLSEEVPIINGIYVDLSTDDPSYILIHDYEFTKITGPHATLSPLHSQLESLAEEGNYPHYYSMKQTLGVESKVFIPYEMDMALPKLYVSRTAVATDDALQGTMVERIFHKNSDQVRKITEANGNVLYVLGKRVLKFSQNGIITYREPQPINIVESNIYQGFNTAINFIEKLHGERENYYLAQIQTIKKENQTGYKLSLRSFIHGMPIILANRDNDSYIEITVFGDRVQEYREVCREETSRYTSTALESRIMLPSFKVLDQNFNILTRVYEQEFHIIGQEENAPNLILGAIEDINLAYLDTNFNVEDEALSACWVIKLGERLLCFDAYDGTLLFEK